jgi:hypothetical protein
VEKNEDWRLSSRVACRFWTGPGVIIIEGDIHAKLHWPGSALYPSAFNLKSVVDSEIAFEWRVLDYEPEIITWNCNFHNIGWHYRS